MKNRLKRLNEIKNEIISLEKEFIKNRPRQIEANAEVVKTVKDVTSKLTTQKNRTHQRDIVIAVCVALFSIESLVGEDRLKRGARQIISKSLELTDDTYISTKLKTIRFWIFNHKDFSQDFIKVYIESIKQLQKK